MQAQSVSQNFGQQVHQLKMSRNEEGGTGPLGKEVSAMAHARNAERKAEEQAIGTPDPVDQVDLNITDGANNDTTVTAIVTHNMNEPFRPDDGATDAFTGFRSSAEGQSLTDVIRSGFSSMLTNYQQQNPQQSAEESLNSFTKLLQDGVEKGFAEAQSTLAGGNTLNEETLNQLTTSKDQVQNLINELAAKSVAPLS